MLDFLIIGAQKSGTTTLHDILRHHPGLALPPGKEHPILNQPGLGPEAARAGLAALFADAGDRLCGKVTPQYLASPFAAKALHEIAPRAHVIAILRDPVERCFSHYRMVMRRRGQPQDFPRAVDGWLDQRALDRARSGQPAPNGDEHDYCVVWSEYGRMLAPYADLFPGLQILRTEDLAVDPGAVIAQILSGLGLDPAWQHDSIGTWSHAGGDKPYVDFNRLRAIPVLGPVMRRAHGLLPERVQMLINTRNIRPGVKSARSLFPSEAARLDAHFATIAQTFPIPQPKDAP